MLIEGQDFDCSSTGVSYLCAARLSDGEQAFMRLQQTLKGALDLISQRQPIPLSTRDLPTDGRITATTALAVQTVLASLSRRLMVPPALQPLLSKTADPSALVRGAAASSLELTAYVEAALQRPEPTVQYQPPPVLKTIGFVGLGVLTLGGLFAVAHSIGSRSSGRVDRSGMLPPPLPEEVDDGGDDDGGDAIEQAADDVTASAGALLPGIA